MKKYRFLIAALIFCSLFACKDDEKEIPWTPGAIKGYTVTPINGGAVITYDIPNDPDILYIMAEYERNGKIFTEKSSVYSNSLTIEGFNHTNKVEASLYKVNKQDQRSEPVVVEFEPLESLIDIAVNSLVVMPGFGGLIASWDNPKETELGLQLQAFNDSINDYETIETYYSTNPEEEHSFRGLDAVETEFALTFEDKWGNVSETIHLTATPFFETMIPKPYADARSFIPYDNISNLSGRNINTLWDNIVNTSAHGWLTQPGNSGLSMTIDLKQVAKLSRVIIHGYHRNAPYGQANFTEFELWGIDKLDPAKLNDKPYWLDETSVQWDAIHTVPSGTPLPEKTFKDDWEYLGHHTIITLDAAWTTYISENGSEYLIPLDAKPVRYVRFFIRAIAKASPPPSTNYWSCGEITFFGDNTVPQE